MTDHAKTVWRTMATTLMGVLLTGAGAWLVFGANNVTRAEMVEHVSSQLRPIERIERSVFDLAKSNQAMLIELKVLSSQFKGYVESHPEPPVYIDTHREKR